MATKTVKVKTYTFEEWAGLRASDPYSFVFTPEGNAFIPAKTAKNPKESRAEQIIEIPIYTLKSSDEQTDLWQARQDKFTKIYKNIEIAKENLRSAFEEYNDSKDGGDTGSTEAIREVVSRAINVAKRERQLTLNRSRERWMEAISNPPVNYIDLENKTETRSMAGILGIDVVYMAKQAVFPYQEFLKEVTGEESSSNLTGGGQEIEYNAITDDTLLGIHWPIELQVGPVKYFTAYQAILGELANQGGDKTLFESILGTRSKRTLHLLTKGLTAQQVDPEILGKITDALVKREDFRTLLLGTGTKGLLYAEEDEPLFGVGMDSEDPNLQNAKRWRGENLWGNALEDARARLREKTVTTQVDEPEENDDPLMAAVISEAEQGAARRGAIINQRRFKH
jgi:predicted NAD-dependent protein-ADP-ribosyltransferase YbiA (DUF1768 family)/ribosomal protein S9